MSNENNIPDEFIKVTKDFINDLITTFPEYKVFIDKWWNTEENEQTKETMETLFEFCKKKFPPRFFDILYQNEDIFKEDSETDTEFLPKIHFKNLWQCDISQTTRETIWKYLQLILFSIIGTLDNKDAFGDTAKLFEAIDQDDFKSKLQETLSQMQGLFDMSGVDMSSNFAEGLNSGDLPNAEEINEHITNMLDGKIGDLAREIAEETAANLNVEFSDATDMKDVFNQLIKNPTKLMDLIKNVGNKLETKLKSGEIKESEMIQEASEIMNKMKNMPGMGNMKSMFNKMGMGDIANMAGMAGMAGMPGMGNSGKMNTGAMESQLNRRLKMAKTKERIKAKAEANARARAIQQVQQQAQQQAQQQNIVMTDDEIITFMNSGEKPEKTPRRKNPTHLVENTENTLLKQSNNIETQNNSTTNKKTNKKKKKK